MQMLVTRFIGLCLKLAGLVRDPDTCPSWVHWLLW